MIASPALLLKTGLKELGELAGQTWVSTETRPGDWENWLEAAGQRQLRASRSLRCDHFFVTLQALVDGLGFGIGPFPTLESDCAAGRLQKPFPGLLAPGSTYYALVPLDADKPVHMRAFIEWLQSLSAAT